MGLLADLGDVPALLESSHTYFRIQETFCLKTLRRCWPDLCVLFEAHRDIVDESAAVQPEDVEGPRAKRDARTSGVLQVTRIR